MPQTILTTAQAAERLGVSERRVQQFCQEGRLGQFVGRQYIITAAEVAAFKRRDRPPHRPKASR